MKDPARFPVALLLFAGSLAGQRDVAERPWLLGEPCPELATDGCTWADAARATRVRPRDGTPALVVLCGFADGDPRDAVRRAAGVRDDRPRRELEIVTVIGADAGEIEEVRSMAAAEGLRDPLLHDPRGTNAAALGLTDAAHDPAALLVDARGVVVWEGPFDRRHEKALERVIDLEVGPRRRPAREFDAHLRALRDRLPHDGFCVVVEPPFVVVGDEPHQAVRRRAQRTVRWAVDLLRKEYFSSDPEPILDVWLFKDRASYNKHTFELFGERPFTPFGFYAARHGALIMNIETGGGTLVHEIVHPFVGANFPECPAWFNEGLGSLYEQCDEREGRIRGLVNWRLPVLQRALDDGDVGSFEALCATTDAEFYGAGSGVRYAQARYLCYWLQERGLLRRFWTGFRAHHPDDPTGYRTLVHVLGRSADEMDAFRREWEAFVRALRYR